MSDLAPFVAAAIRDKVVSDQQHEIERLRGEVRALQKTQHDLELQLHERCPVRSVQIRGPPSNNGLVGHVHLDSELDLVDLPNTVDLFVGETDLSMPVEEFLKLELFVDENSSFCFRDFEFTACRYFVCGFTNERFTYVKLRHHQESEFLSLHAYMGPFAMEEYLKLVNLPLTGLEPSSSSCDPIFDARERVFPMENLYPFQNKFVKIVFDLGTCQCSADFVLNHLRAPYVP
jgi:hypothetical protein